MLSKFFIETETKIPSVETPGLRVFICQYFYKLSRTISEPLQPSPMDNSLVIFAMVHSSLFVSNSYWSLYYFLFLKFFSNNNASSSSLQLFYKGDSVIYYSLLIIFSTGLSTSLVTLSCIIAVDRKSSKHTKIVQTTLKILYTTFSYLIFSLATILCQLSMLPSSSLTTTYISLSLKNGSFLISVQFS